MAQTKPKHAKACKTTSLHRPVDTAGVHSETGRPMGVCSKGNAHGAWVSRVSPMGPCQRGQSLLTSHPTESGVANRKEPPTLFSKSNAHTDIGVKEITGSRPWSNASPQVRYCVSAIHDLSSQCQQASDLYSSLVFALAPEEDQVESLELMRAHSQLTLVSPDHSLASGEKYTKLWDLLQQSEEESPKSDGLAVNPWETLD